MLPDLDGPLELRSTKVHPGRADGPMPLGRRRTLGGTVARALLPLTCALPVGLAAGQIAGLYALETTIWLFYGLIVMVLIPLGWMLGATLERAERERMGAQALSREAQRDRVAFEEAPIGSVITGRDGRIERVSQAFCAMTGRSPDDLIGVDLATLAHPGDQDRSAFMAAALLTDDTGTLRFDKRYLHSSGRVIEGRVALTAIFDDDRQVAQFFAQIEDVTDARRTSRELEGAQFEMLARLAMAAELHDDETGQHTRRVGEMAALIARCLGLSDTDVELLRLAAPLHDVGKIAIPDAVLGKPGKLTFTEFEQMKTHTAIGAQMLTGSTFALLVMAESITLTHHEKWDGTGYPNGLAGDAIPITGRIVAVADVFDALTHSRPYKAAWTTDDAIAEIVGQAGRHFDPRVVNAFIAGVHTEEQAA